MRVTDNMRFRSLNENLGSLQARHADATRRASTGLRLDSPSEDPLGAGQVTRIQSTLRMVQTYQQNIQTARGDVATSENALEQATDVMRRIRELALQGANDSLNADNRALLARDARGLWDELKNLANTQGSYGYLFSGHQTETAAFTNGGIYNGDDGVRSLEIAAGFTVQVNIDGNQTFGGSGGGVNAFTEISALITALEADDGAGIAASLDGIDAAHEQIVRSRAEAGLILNRLDTASETLAQGEVTLTQRSSDITDADMVAAFSDLTSLSQTLEQAIAVARSTLGMTLTRF